MTDVAQIRSAAAKTRRWGWWYVAEMRLREMRGYISFVVTSSLGNPLMYLLGLGVGLANLVPNGIEGQPFLIYVGPALLMSTIIAIGAEEGMYPVLGGFKWQKTFHAIHATAVSPGQLVAGFLVHIAIRLAFTAGIFYAMLIAFGAVPLGTGWLMIPIAILGAYSILTPLAAFSAGIQDDTGQFALVQRLIVMPMFLFSGTFFPISQIPDWLEWIGWFSPLWHASQLGRAVAYGLVEPLWLVTLRLAILAGYAVTGAVLMRRVFEKRLTR
jgi:lipooligosaccharide transport system permease protein